jgi:tetratricopeptide (TPR) repeat protein
MKALGEQIYRVGEIEIDASQGSIRRNGEEQYLRQKAFQLLLYLLERRQRLVPKQELVEAIWEGTAVGDDALVQLVKEVRRSLGDDPRQPQFIKTFPKIGYRFIGPVQGRFIADLATIETREVTTVELEYEEEDSDRRQSAEAIPQALPAAALKRWGSSRLLLISAAMLIMAIPFAIFLGQRLWPAKQASAEKRLPQVAGKKSLAVMYFDNQAASTEFDWLREGLADMLITDLSRSSKLTVLSRGQLHVLLDRIGHNAGERIELDQALDIAKRIEAEAIVLGSFARLDGQIRIDAQLHDARTGQIIAAERLIVDKPADILTQLDLLSMKLAAQLTAEPTNQEEQTGLADVMTNNLEAYRNYSLGLEKALALESTGAIALFKRAIALDPQFAMAHARIGYTYAVSWVFGEKAKSHLERAFQLSERLTEKDKLHIIAWYAIANLDYASAISTFRKIIAQYPLEVEAYLRLGALLQGEEQLEESVGVARQGLAIDPEAEELCNLLGNNYLYLSRHDEALAMYRRYVELAPKEANAYDSLGSGYQWAGRYAEAIEAYNRALALKPDFEIALVHLANVYFQQGRYREAVSNYERYIQIAQSDFDRGRGYSNLIYLFLRSGDLEGARHIANKSIKYSEMMGEYLMLLALEQGNLKMAENLNQRLFEKWLYTNRGASRELRSIYYAHGYFALKQGRSAEAIEDFKEALRRRPPFWNIDSFEDCLANAYLELGRLDEAIAEYERILSINPNYPLAHYHLAEAYERKGEQDKARDEYERFLETWKDSDPDITEIIASRKRLISQS